MKQTIALLSRKGGAGKSSTISAIAAGLNKRGYRVLVCDVDGQANTTYIMRAARGKREFRLKEALETVKK